MDTYDVIDIVLLGAINALQEARKVSDLLRDKHARGEMATTEDVLAVLDSTRQIGDDIRKRIASGGA